MKKLEKILDKPIINQSNSEKVVLSEKNRNLLMEIESPLFRFQNIEFQND